MGNFTQSISSRRPVVVGTLSDYAVEFNVSANPQHLSAPLPADLEGATNYAIGLWVVRLGDFNSFGSHNPLFQIGVAGGSTTTGVGFSAHQNENVRFSPPNVATTNMPEIPVALLPIDTPVHLMGVCEGSAMRLYVDGQLQDSTSNGGPMPADMSGYAVNIGAAQDGERPVPMRASNLQVWNIAPTEQQIQDLAMKRISSPFPTGLVFYAPM